MTTRATAPPLSAPALTLTVIIPAHDEEQSLPDTLRSITAQTSPPDKIIVVGDGSTDRTGAIAAAFTGVTVLRPPHHLGGKARAQNHALPHCDTDLILAVDAGTVLAPDYIERVKPAFADPDVGVAAGNVQTRFTRTPWERGRSTEYLFGFHWHRPIQQLADSPMVCSGCCSVFRRTALTAAGGFPERTIVEDMDFTWTQQAEGRKAVYVSDAVAWAADPETLPFLRKQVWRWMAGFMQNVRLHLPRLLVRKPMLATWVVLALLEILLAPLWWLTPLIAVLTLHDPFPRTMFWWAGSDLLLTVPALLYAAGRRRIPTRLVLLNLPFVYLNKTVNLYYAWKALLVELVLVPLGLSRGLLVHEKGR
ncbi:glycosyltransferase family 2 protein [Actinomadura sp. ATCC 31491]|uniref:Glycosyltransferase family 2 protein n=1 Tax=Actinomadura luzonensis TaxID=2805427 RepID=A0ABT0G129_9ACTN|nr:glycosyltransferase family 2 protein [Actinomadura luzonensis]MCK2217890.1 glycosyltransferase family 2 protein [Actinomadura luzonensis]